MIALHQKTLVYIHQNLKTNILQIKIQQIQNSQNLKSYK